MGQRGTFSMVGLRDSRPGVLKQDLAQEGCLEGRSKQKNCAGGLLRVRAKGEF